MKQQIKRNALAYYCYFVVTAVATFVTSPFLIGYLGSGSFGAFKAAQKLMDIASVADGRSAQALKWITARLLGSGDHERLSRSVSSAVLVAGAFMLPLLSVVTLIAFASDSLIRVDETAESALIASCVAILGLNLVLSPLLTIPDAALVGSNRGYISTVSQTFWFALANALMVFFAWAGYSIVYLALAVLIGTIGNGLSLLVYTRRSTQWFRWARPSRDEVRSFTGLSGWLLAWAGVEKFLLAGELLLISSMIGATSVTEYVLATYVSQLILAVTLMTASAVTPSIGQLITLKLGQARRLIISLREVIFAIASLGASGLLLLNGAFVSLWVGSEYFVGGAANLLIALAMVEIAMIRFYSQIGDLTLKVRSRALLGIATTALTILVPLGVAQFRAITLEAMIAAILIARLPLLFYLAWQVRALIRIPSIGHTRIITAIVLMSACYILGTRVEPRSWFQFSAAVCLMVVVAVPTLSLAILSPQTRRHLGEAISRRIRKEG